jgi:hypothetical protein
MNIAVLLMSSDVEPSLRNIEAFKSTVVDFYENNKQLFGHDYKFFVYRYGETPDVYVDQVYKSVTYLVFKGDESVYSTFEKTVSALEYVKVMYQPDMYIRINISTHINMLLLDSVAQHLDTNCVYCNRINNFVNPTSKYFGYVYPRGDFMIFFGCHCKAIIDNCCKCLGVNSLSLGVDHVDDCLIGICLLYSDPDYYKRMNMLIYNFMPNENIEVDKYNNYAIATRLKSVPRGKNSGYSWDDNEYRLNDVKKFYQTQELVNKSLYKDVKLSDVVTDEVYPLIEYRVINVTKEEYNNYIKRTSL